MRHINGNLVVRAGDTTDYSDVTSVDGDVEAREGAHIDLSACARVDGDVEAWEGAQLDLGACTSVGGDVVAWEGAQLDLRACTSMHGGRGRLLAVSEYYLWLGEDGLYYAGCHRRFTREEALAHWGGRTDPRARVFTAAILKEKS